jgi:hypothetical protein
VKTGILTALALLFLCGQALVAQNTERNPLGKLTHLKCTFTVTASASWKAGPPEVQVKSEELSVAFAKIDLDSGTAEVEAAGGAIDVVALLTGSSVHILERSFQGNLTVTSIFAPANARGKFRAVRSRHDYLMMNIPGFVAEPTVQQRSGECEGAA